MEGNKGKLEEGGVDDKLHKRFHKIFPRNTIETGTRVDPKNPNTGFMTDNTGFGFKKIASSYSFDYVPNVATLIKDIKLLADRYKKEKGVESFQKTYIVEGLTQKKVDIHMLLMPCMRMANVMQLYLTVLQIYLVLL